MEQALLFKEPKKIVIRQKPIEKPKKFLQILKHDRKAKLIVVFGLDSEGNRDFSVYEESDSDASIHISAHSSAFTKKPTLEENLEDCLDWYTNWLLEHGYKKENIEIIKRESTEEEMQKDRKFVIDRLEDSIKWIEKEINEYRQKLTENLKKLIEKENKLKEFKEKWGIKNE